MTRRHSITFNKPSLTEKSHAAQTNIQNIMAKYERTGVIEHSRQYQGTYGDFANLPTFQRAQQIIADASTMFESIPATIRADFNNRPEQFLDFIQNPENREQIESYGFTTDHLPPSPTPNDLPESTPTPPEPSPQPSTLDE